MRAVLLLACRDRPGLVAAVGEFVVGVGGNIVHADQHVDPVHDLFLQRVEFDAPLDAAAVRERFTDVGERFAMQWQLHAGDERPRVVILVSREGHCLADLLGRVELRELDVEVAAVASNHDALEPMARRFGVTFHHLPVVDDARAERERDLGALIDGYAPDLVVLARYMRVLPGWLVSRYREGIINIHHSFLPAFAGARPYHQAYERGVKVIGATAHYVTDELDEGPIIVQEVTSVSHRDQVHDLIRRGRDLERVVLATAVRLHLEHRIVAYANRTVVFD
jgi:formyltetrahydrofolate deformylase